MSHTATVTTQLKNVGAIARVCEQKKYEYKVGKHQVRLFSGTVSADASFKLPGWNYPVAVNTETGEVKYDNYNGHWGKDEYLNQFQQDYAVEVVREGAAALIEQGFTETQVQLENGDIQLMYTKA